MIKKASANVAVGKCEKKDDVSDLTIVEMLEQVIAIGKYSFELQQRRENCIAHQAGQMLIALSFSTAALYASIQTVPNGVLSARFVFFAAGCVFLPLVASTICSSVTLWQSKKFALQSIKVFYNHVNENSKVFSRKEAFLKTWETNISDLDSGLRRQNNRHVKWLKASLVMYWIAIGIACMFVVIASFLMLHAKGVI